MNLRHESLIDAWMLGARYVVSAVEPDFAIILSAGSAWLGTSAETLVLDRAARAHGWERPSSVSEMILPRVADLSRGSVEEAIDLGLRALGRGRRRGLRYSGWTHTYFERMVGMWDDKDGNRHQIRPNRLASVIEKLNLWKRNVEAACYIHTDLESDGFRTRGGPCLQYVQFRAHGAMEIEVIALYRAHDYGNKALGNLVGLQKLGRFVGRHTGRTLSGVTVLSLHPYCSNKGRLVRFIQDVAD